MYIKFLVHVYTNVHMQGGLKTEDCLWLLSVCEHVLSEWCFWHCGNCVWALQYLY